MLTLISFSLDGHLPKYNSYLSSFQPSGVHVSYFLCLHLNPIIIITIVIIIIIIIIVTMIIIIIIITIIIIIIIISCLLLLQKPLILEAKGIKIGFLGYCDTPSMMGLNCTEIRKLFNAGPAVYSDVIATRDVSNLKKVFTLLFYKLL